MIIQSIILILSSLSIYLISLNNSKTKYGFLLGLFAQPFWLYETFINKQYGMLLLTLFYIFSYIKGYKNFN